MRLDKTAYKKQPFSEASEHQKVYNAMSETERAEAFFQLMQAAFGFMGKNWPRMEKSFFTSRKQP